MVLILPGSRPYIARHSSSHGGPGMVLLRSDVSLKCLYLLVISIALWIGPGAGAQESATQGTPDAEQATLVPGGREAACETAEWPGRSCFQSDRAFPNFIGFVSNPTRSFDPRSLSQLWPIFSSAWTDRFGPIPGGDIQGS